MGIIEALEKRLCAAEKEIRDNSALISILMRHLYLSPPSSLTKCMASVDGVEKCTEVAYCMCRTHRIALCKVHMQEPQPGNTLDCFKAPGVVCGFFRDGVDSRRWR